MSTTRWQQVRDVFDVVAEASPVERESLLDAIAGDDDELKRDVRALLDALDADAERFEHEGVALARAVLDEDDDTRRIGLELGPYRLVRRIGEGGMGYVYLAERSDGAFTRRVAVKLIKPGMATKHVMSRFRQERQILAGLDHPSIAALLDGGVTPDGQPYLVMEYVEGEPITTYCQRHRLPIEARIRLFREVCAAVHSAHQQLVIHRDLKPANILVTAQGAAKLLDFGVAKLLRPTDEAVLTHTVFGGRAFTPSYASPEQVRGEPVTTASDVYSLGIILYELLTGRLPFVSEHGSMLDVMQAVSTAEPTRPSVAVETTADDASRPMRARRALRRQLSGDLDNIVLMAIRKQPDRRYASADALSEDLRRFLSKQPVMARADSALYRLGKFMSRNGTVVAGAAGILLALAIGTVGTLTQAQRAATQRAIAVQRMHDVRDLANSLLFEVHDAIADLPGATEARRLVLQRGFENLEQLAAEVDSDTEVQWQLAEAYLRVGLVQGQPAGASLGDLDGARRTYARAIDIATRLVAADRSDLRARRTLALATEKLGDVDAWSGDVEAGVAHAQVALELYRSIARARPDSARHQLSLAISHVKLGDLSGNPLFPNLGRTDDAMVNYRAAFALLQSPPLSISPSWDTRRHEALIQERIGNIHRFAGRFDDARVSFTRSLERRIALAAEEPASADARRDVGVAQQNLCEVEIALGFPARALPLCRAAVDVYEEMHATDPRNVQGRSDVGVGSRSLANALLALGDSVAALGALERGADVLRPAHGNAPDHLPIRRELSRLLAQHTLVAHAIGRPTPFRAEVVGMLHDLRDDDSADAADIELLGRLERMRT